MYIYVLYYVLYYISYIIYLYIYIFDMFKNYIRASFEFGFRKADSRHQILETILRSPEEEVGAAAGAAAAARQFWRLALPLITPHPATLLTELV